jgi:hypothetical protein
MKSRKPQYDHAGVSSNPEQPPHPGDPMSPASKLQYFGVSVPRRRYQQWRGFWFIDLLSAPTDPQLHKWWARRAFYYISVMILFGIIAFYVGPNELNFGQLRSPTAADFVPDVEVCIPVVRAMKEFQRDHGRWASDERELVPNYLREQSRRVHVINGWFWSYGKWDQSISYDFAPGRERWMVCGPAVTGTIPAPLVTIGPSTTEPTTRTGQ